MGKVSAIIVYPIKACQGIQVPEARLTAHGTLEHDREWCIVDERGDRYPPRQALSQRLCPVLASIGVKLDTARASLTLSAPGMGLLSLDLSHPGALIQVECGGASTTSAGAWHLGLLDGSDAGDAASEWLSQYLNRADSAKASKPEARFRLLRATTVRSLARYAGPEQVPFSSDVALQREGKASPFQMQGVNVKPSDGFLFHDVAPLHVASAASFAQLRAKMAKLTPQPTSEELASYSVGSFRPNVVVSGGKPWAEEDWELFSLGNCVFRLLKGCPRCTVPARNQTTGKFHFASKPLLAPQTALRRYWSHKCVDPEWEKEWEGPIFGIHAGLDHTADALGPGSNPNSMADPLHVLRVEDELTVHRWKVRPMSKSRQVIIALTPTVIVAVGLLAYMNTLLHWGAPMAWPWQPVVVRDEL